VFFESLFRLFTSADLWRASLEAAAVLLLPALGGLISENSGVTNVAMEGMMLVGAFFGAIVVLATHNVIVAVLAAILTGGVMALVHAFSIQFKANQIVSGVAINIAAAGLTSFLLFNLTPKGQGVPSLTNDLRIPLLGIPRFTPTPVNIGFPVIGGAVTFVQGLLAFIDDVFLQQYLIFYLAVLVLIATQYVLFHTNIGLRIRAVGEHPQAADTAGINVRLVRYLCVVASGLLSGLAGAYLSLGIAGVFIPNMTAGRGFIALAAMIFGKWKPRGTAVACLIFGLGLSLQNRLVDPLRALGVTANADTLTALLAAIPYVLTILALVGLVGRAVAPAADGIPYEPGGE
jgi:ABC-type uncharacterized transport system permease subunit